ncbi:YrhK family protein [Kocuria palustris]|uniref:YrhK family protein n=1 Tax=Kocuria palustris TaxID=71999 RepID=UPI00119D8A0B|nr:YrhK family protein [Kocuria palustris]
MTHQDRDLEIRIGSEELVIRQRYETLSIANDLLLGVVFLVGSILFFGEDTTYAGTWLFVLGSVQMMLRPTIRLMRQLHLQRLRPVRPHETSMDF